MANYRRSYVKGGSYFFTVNLQTRNSSLLIDNIDVLRKAIISVRRLRPFQIDAWVVLPDHMHTVWTLPRDDCDYSSRWRDIKKRFSSAIQKTECLSANQQKRNERGIWQRRFWEHTISSSADFEQHINYVHINPLKHGLVNRVVDWPYSSFHWWVKHGFYSADWCGV